MWPVALLLLVAVLTSGLLGGCQGGSGIQAGAGLTVSVIAPAELRGGEDAPWRVTASGGAAPYQLSLDFGQGVWGETPAELEFDGDYSAAFRMVNPSITDPELYIYKATVSDAQGAVATATDYYTVAPLIPVLEIVKLKQSNEGIVFLTMRFNDPEMPEINVTASGGIYLLERYYESYEPPPGELTITIDLTPGVNHWDYLIPYYATDIIDGGSGILTFTAVDSWGNTAEEEIEVTAPGRYELPFHSLAAIPLDRRVAVGETARVVVACGDFPSARPFQYMNGVGVTVDAGASYVDQSFNYGAPGGGKEAADGLWSRVAPGGFMEDYDIMKQEEPIGAGRVRLDFYIVPIGGVSTTKGGVLFTFELDFDQSGTYTLGFQQFDEVDRTFYGDSASDFYYWADISNDYPNVPNSISVW